MLIVYQGPYESVDVPAAELTAVRDVPVEVPDELAQSLLDQGDDWAKAKKTAKVKE